MRFKSQIEQILQCKVDGMCARDQLVTEYLKSRSESFNELLNTKELDDKLIEALVKELNDERE